jgi:hypothetical protein
MKNISTIVSAVLLTSTIYAQNINITTGWQLKGTESNYSNMNDFNKSCIDLVWKYNKNTSTWSAYSPNSNTAQLITDSTTIDTLSNINENDGFWIKANSDCNIVNEPIVSDNNISIETGFTQEYLKGKTFYGIVKYEENDLIYNLAKHTFDANGNIVKIEIYNNGSYTEDNSVVSSDTINGILTISHTDNEWSKSQIQFVTNDFITISTTYDDNETATEYLYFDEDKARNALLDKSKKFTQDYLDGKTFYAIYDWKDKVTDPEKWVLVKEQFDVINHTFNEYNIENNTYGSDEVEPMSIVNGLITVTPTDNSGVYTQKILSVDNDKISILISGGFNDEEYLYFDEDKAKAELQSRTISVENGFGEKWLDGRTLWYVDTDEPPYKMYKIVLENNIFSIYDSNGELITDDNNKAYQQPYTVTTDGIIKVDESGLQWLDDSDYPEGYPANSFEYYKIQIINGSSIGTCDGMVLSEVQACTSTDEPSIFTNEADAQAYLNSF